MSKESYNILQRNNLNLKLRPIFIAQMTVMNSLDHPAYYYDEGMFHIALRANEGVTQDFIRKYAQTRSSEIFISESDFNGLHEKIHNELNRLTRKLSNSDTLKNATKQVNLLSMQMANLYNNPYDDELLNSQFLCSKNFSSMLLDNKAIHKSLYKNVKKQNHHYTISQPLLSSILLLSFTQSTGMFSDKEVQNLFLTSYFKDIGMSYIPREKFQQAHLDEVDFKLFSEHSINSMNILEGRVPLNKTQLNMIRNHHQLNEKIQSMVGQEVEPKSAEDEDEDYITGVESVLLNGMDILVAMTSERPYRDSDSFFRALELLKQVVADEYPQEFKNLVIFLKHFFRK